MHSRLCLIGVILTVALVPSLAHAQSDDRYTIMRPEKNAPPEQPTPWLPPKYKSPRGLPQHVKPVRPMEVPRLGAAPPPPPIMVPQTGAVLPNMPTLSPSGPGGRETYQDRAVRCAHQAGSYGAAAGDRNSYIGTCINQ